MITKSKKGLTDLWKTKVTIYSNVPDENNTSRSIRRFVIERCQVYGQVVEKPNQTIRNVINAKSVTTKNVEQYKPLAEFIRLSEEERRNYYTAEPGDFVVCGEVNDVVSTVGDFAELQKKYRNNGMKVTTVDTYINGMTVDNITMSNA